MKRILLLILCVCPSLLSAQEVVHSVTAETTRMSEATLKKRFHLKEGEAFTEKEYQKAQADLHKLRVFKTLEFIEKKRTEGVDIHIKVDDRS